MPSRFLVVTLDAAGNWPPERVLVQALVERGHHVRVVSDATHAEQIEAAGAVYEPFRIAPAQDATARVDAGDQAEMTRFLREVFLNRAYAEELLAALERDRPDVVLVDQMLLMATVAALHTGLPNAVLWHTVYAGSAAMFGGGGPMTDAVNGYRTHLGLPTVTTLGESVEQTDAVLAFTYREIDAPSDRTPSHVHHVGALACVPSSTTPAFASPWADDDGRPLLLVSYSTSYQHQVATLQRVADAVAELPVRVLLTLGRAIAASELRLPGNVVAEPFVPHAAVLPHARLVITHAGHGTVMAATTAGVPMLCTPMGRDQHMVAACVDRCGLGRVIDADAPVTELRAAIAAAIADDAELARAQRFAASLDPTAGLRRAVDVLESLPARR